MNDPDQMTQAEAIQLGPSRAGSAGLCDAIQGEAPSACDGQYKKPSFKRRLLTIAVALIVICLVGTVLGVIPCSYSSFLVGGRRVVVVSYSPSIATFSTPEMTRVETGGQSVTVWGDVVDLGSGSTVIIPDWCKEVRLAVRWGRASVTFTAP